MIISDEQWAHLGPLLPIYKKSPKGGRPRIENRTILEGILYVKRNKIPWNAAPSIYGSGTTLNEYFRSWAKSGVFHQLKNFDYRLVHNFDWDEIKNHYQPTPQNGEENGK